jgi:hypothetical protein
MLLCGGNEHRVPYRWHGVRLPELALAQAQAAQHRRGRASPAAPHFCASLFSGRR